MADSKPFSEDFLGTIVNVSWGSGDILWINGSVIGDFYTYTYVNPRYFLQMQSVVYPQMNQDIMQAAGVPVPEESGQSNGVFWCYAPHHSDRRIVHPVTGAVITDTALVRFAESSAMNLGPAEETIDFTNPDSVKHFAQVSNQFQYSIVAVLTSHVSTGQPHLESITNVQSNTFFNLTNIKNNTKGKFFTFRLFAAATFPGESGHTIHATMTSWARSQATPEIPFSEIKKFPVTPEGAPDETRFRVPPKSSLGLTLDGNTTPASTFQVNLETLEITQVI